ncbi:MAG: Asp-tRNA(Asn)/Glu-tRNA(Gln) amidotransferase subunit GatA [FCB group bacterium]|nr:Asp-tRNA(Asn)/Glu-tRNA(Gln) amidotransferase subunit GatA [FCB group bacterium]
MNRLRTKIVEQEKLAERLTNLNIFVRTRREKAEREAATNSGLLTGNTIAVKDNIAIKDEPLTCASRILTGYTSPFTATAVERIIAAGGAIIGQTNQDEFAMGSSSENSIYGPVRNPHDPDRVTGGSSGGSAAAVAAGLADMSIGSDTGGSVRQPAAFCGVYGLKPTYGRVSRYGLVAFASSFDQIGPLAKSVDDLTRLFVTIAGHDDKDSTSADKPVPTVEECLQGPLPKRIGIPRSLLKEGVAKDILVQMEVLEKFCRKSGMDIVEISLPHAPYAIATYYILATAEASSNLARFDGIRYGYRHPDGNISDLYELSRANGFGPEVKRRIMLGTYILSAGYYDAYYTKAQKVRTLIKQDFINVFEDVDLVFLPTAPTTAFKVGSLINNPLEMYLADIFTVPISLAGVPAISIPAGTDRDGLPIGLQIVGDYFREETILSFCRKVEQANLF